MMRKKNVFLEEFQSTHAKEIIKWDNHHFVTVKELMVWGSDYPEFVKQLVEKLMEIL